MGEGEYKRNIISAAVKKNVFHLLVSGYVKMISMLHRRVGPNDYSVPQDMIPEFLDYPSLAL